MALPRTIRSYLKKTLTLDEVRAALRAVGKGKHAGSSVLKTAQRLVDMAATDALTSDLLLHDGDLSVKELRTGIKPFIGLLIVRGDLIVDGLYQDGLDPDATVIVTGDLRADRLISEGFLEVHGSVEVAHEALWLDNDGCAEIFGDLRAGFAYTKYHSVKVHGEVAAPLVLGDDQRIEAKKKYAFVDETDDAHKVALRAVLPASALSIEGDPDDEDEDEWCIDYVKDDVLRKLVIAGTRVLTAPWPKRPAGKAKR